MLFLACPISLSDEIPTNEDVGNCEGDIRVEDIPLVSDYMHTKSECQALGVCMRLLLGSGCVCVRLLGSGRSRLELRVLHSMAIKLNHRCIYSSVCFQTAVRWQGGRGGCEMAGGEADFGMPVVVTLAWAQ